jgi:hypothetical protein
VYRARASHFAPLSALTRRVPEMHHISFRPAFEPKICFRNSMTASAHIVQEHRSTDNKYKPAVFILGASDSEGYTSTPPGVHFGLSLDTSVFSQYVNIL